MPAPRHPVTGISVHVWPGWGEVSDPRVSARRLPATAEAMLTATVAVLAGLGILAWSARTGWFTLPLLPPTISAYRRW